MLQWTSPEEADQANKTSNLSLVQKCRQSCFVSRKAEFNKKAAPLIWNRNTSSGIVL